MQLVERQSPRSTYAAETDEWDAFRLEIREALASMRRHAFAITLCVLGAVALATPVIALRTPNYLGTPRCCSTRAG